LVTCAALGCAGRSGHGHGGGAGEPGLEPTERGVITPDVTQVAALTQVDAILGYPRPAGQFHALSPADCQCMAVNAAPRANLLDGERRALAARESRGLCQHEDNSLTYDVLRTAALEDRNRQAGEALNDYYLLAQREAQLDLVGRAIADARRGVEGFSRAHEQGLITRADKTEFPRREIELRDQQAQLQNGVTQLNSRLWNFIGVTPQYLDDRIWPTTDMTVTVEPIDVELAVQIGLATRPELGLLRRARSASGQQLASARVALSQVSPLLGLAPQPAKCDGPFGILEALKSACNDKRELAERQQQLNRLAWQREQEVATEIRQNVATVELRLRQVALAKEAVAQWRSRGEELQGRSQTGGATYAEVIGGRLSLIQAESDLIEQIAAWKIAQARLKQSQGLLIAECCQ
ncbi:MAG TPA: hypothetical protein VGJ26_09445, partial [Pirellulales bacterium]